MPLTAIRHPPRSGPPAVWSRPHLCAPLTRVVCVAAVLGCSSPGCDKRAEYGVRCAETASSLYTSACTGHTRTACPTAVDSSLYLALPMLCVLCAAVPGLPRQAVVLLHAAVLPNQLAGALPAVSPSLSRARSVTDRSTDLPSHTSNTRQKRRRSTANTFSSAVGCCQICASATERRADCRKCTGRSMRDASSKPISLCVLERAINQIQLRSYFRELTTSAGT